MRDRFLLVTENALRARQKEDEALREEEINRLQARTARSGLSRFPQSEAPKIFSEAYCRRAI